MTTTATDLNAMKHCDTKKFVQRKLRCELVWNQPDATKPGWWTGYVTLRTHDDMERVMLAGLNGNVNGNSNPLTHYGLHKTGLTVGWASNPRFPMTQEAAMKVTREWASAFAAHL